MVSSNRQIVKNTLIIYIRIFITVLVGLLTARFVLQELGAADYGLYNVVGSIIALYAFISGSLSSTTVRFLNFEMGKEKGDINKLFNICNVLHICLAIIILFISESIGIWYVLNYLNILPEKLMDAMFVFQVSIIVSCIGIINVPYQSLFNVHEDFLTPAILDIVCTILKLVLVLLLFVYDGNKLRFYALSMSLLTFIYFVAYHYISKKRWAYIIRWNLVKDFSLYKEVIIYNNYTILQTLSTTIRNQGSNILINFFFGTIVNAAFAIANTLQNYVTIFMSTFDGASGPQITQKIASNNYKEAFGIANKISRICILLCEMIALPLYVEMDFILKLWLGNPPTGAATFCRLILGISLVASTSGGIFQIINASGKVKSFRIVTSICFLSCLPIGFLAYKLGSPSYFILFLFIISDIVNRALHLFLMKRILNYKVVGFLKEAYLRPTLIFILMVLFVLSYASLGKMDTFMSHVGGFIGSSLISLFLVYAIGLKRQEKILLNKFILSKVVSR